MKSLFKHHEYIGDVDYHETIHKLYHDDFSLDQRSLKVHEDLISKSNNLPFRKLQDKNGDVVSDIYNHVIGYTKKIPLAKLKMQSESTFEHMFLYQHGREHGVLGLLLRKAATLYSIHQAIEKYGKWNDPIIVLYDEFKDVFHVVHGQQRYFYGKLMGIDPEAFVYSLGETAAKKMQNYIPDLDFNWGGRWKEFFFHPKGRGGEYTKALVTMFLAQDDSREDVMKEHQQNTYDFASLYTSLGEEVYYYHDDTYLAFMPNKYASKKVRVNVEDEFGFVQHMLWKYCEVDPYEFKMNRKFEVGDF